VDQGELEKEYWFLEADPQKELEEVHLGRLEDQEGFFLLEEERDSWLLLVGQERDEEHVLEGEKDLQKEGDHQMGVDEGHLEEGGEQGEGWMWVVDVLEVGFQIVDDFEEEVLEEVLGEDEQKEL